MTTQYRLNIIQDDCNESPRTWDNLGTIKAWHRDYGLSDSDKHGRDVCSYSQETFWAELAQEYAYDALALACKVKGLDVDDCWEDLDEDLCRNIAEERVIVLPVYLYDHGGITISTGSFSCRWDSGQVGWIFCPKGTEDLSDKQIESNLEAEIKVYAQYLEGDVYGFTLEKVTLDEDGDDDEVEELDSCWGFYGSDPAENGITDHLSVPLDQCEVIYQ